MSWRKFILVALSLAALLGCHPDPPAAWDDGGAALVLPNATLERHDRDPVQLYADGRVTRDGDVVYVIDRAGRVTDEDFASVALLLPSGHLVGNDDVYLGRVGVRNASPPWSAVAWLRVAPSGALLLFDTAGEPLHKGRWTGCAGAGLRACTLVSHLLTLASARRYQQNDTWIGVGVGVGIWH